MPLERLQKVLAASGVASRRASEVLIANGRVTVDGKAAKLGMQVDPDKAVIAVDGRVIGAASAPEYILLHKPAGVTSTVRDRHASKTVLDMIPTALLPEGGRLYPVGRLDQDSEGLLVLTNDGAWADRVLHPRHGIEREYAIGLRAALTGDQVAGAQGRDRARRGPGHLDRAPPDDRHRDAAAGRARRATARRPGLVSRHPGPGLEAPAAPDVRRGRRPDRAAGPGPHRTGPARRPVERPCASPAGAGGPGPGRRRGDEPGGRQGWRTGSDRARTGADREGAAGPPPMSESRTLWNARLIDGRGGAPIERASVTIADGRIGRVGTRDRRAAARCPRSRRPDA